MRNPLDDFLAAVSEWAAGNALVYAVALVGSHGRGEATPDSDIDLVIVGDAPALLGDAGWVQHFGVVRQLAVEDYGVVTSLRVHYAAGAGVAAGLEVEYGIAGKSWAQLPLDPGTAAVMHSGFKGVYDPVGLLNC
jgi:predicted nucleotidyltransferase